MRGTRQEAEARLRDVMRDQDLGQFVKPAKTPLIDYLRAWLVTQAPVAQWRPATIRLYRAIIERHIAKHPIAFRPIQQLRPSHLEGYLASLTTSAAASVAVHHAVLHRALRRAVKDRLLVVSPAVDLDGRRRRDRTTHARGQCWSAAEARRFLETAGTASPQVAAYLCVALDSGARRSELDGLGWQHLDLDAGRLTIERQLDRAGEVPVFGPTKTDRARTIALGPETLDALRLHKATQAALKMRHRTSYADHGLVFAKEDADLLRPAAALGQPIRTLGGARFVRLITQAQVPRIKFHGLRHTCATLLLAAGEPVHVVAARLGHASATTTLGTYAHAMPGMQQAAATTLSRLLHAQGSRRKEC